VAEDSGALGIVKIGSCRN